MTSLHSHLMKAADILPHEQVHVLDIENGARLVTYAIESESGSGRVELNGAAAKLVDPGDHVIVIAYADIEEAELAGFEPRVVLVDDDNRPR